jgi:hemerythrin-like metal-binding protein
MGEIPAAWRQAVGRIVEEHAELHQSMRQFLAGVRERRAPGVLLGLHAELARLLEAHFADEERLMQQVDFPERHAHRLLHQACLAQIRAEGEPLGLGRPRPLEVYQELLRVWIVEHMRVQDRRFEDFLGAKPPGRDPR